MKEGMSWSISSKEKAALIICWLLYTLIKQKKKPKVNPNNQNTKTPNPTNLPSRVAVD